MRQFHMRVHRPLPILTVLALIAILWTAPARAQAQDNPLPLLPGLENAVEFWKQAFTRYGANDVIFHDRKDPLKIYQVLTIEDGPAGRKTMKDEIERIAQAEAGSDVRAQRGVKERFAAGLALSRRYIDQMRQIFREEGLPEDIAYLPLVES